MTWIEVSSVRAREPLPAVTDLGPGEAEVIALGLENRNCLLILDDLLARRIAALNGLPFTGTLGVLLKAKQERHVETVRPLIQQLRTAGLWLSDDVVAAVLARAGEAP